MNKDLMDMSDIKMLLNQDENTEFRIMNLGVEVFDNRKYRFKITYSKNLKYLLGPFQEELVDIGESMYKYFRKSISEIIELPDNVKYSIMSVSVESNSLANYIKIDVPFLRLIPEDLNKKERMILKYICERLEAITIQLTERLYSYIDESLNYLIDAPKVDEFELIMYYDGDNLLYNDFVQTTDIDYALEKYNIFKLVNEEKLLERIENKFFEIKKRISKHRYFKVNFNYENNEIKNLSCLPMLSPANYA